MLTDIRKLAKQRDSKLLYSSTKEIKGIKLFSNEIDFTYLQKLYLIFLSFYHTIYTDLALKKVSDKVLFDEINEDAYMVFKDKQEDKEDKNIDNSPHDVHLVPYKKKRVK